MLGRLSRGLKKFGDFISTFILVIFYFTLFAVFAVCVRLFSDFLGKRPKSSNFIGVRSRFEDLESFRHEG
ncbi:MAG: hypothetical protein ABSF47_01370 [Minisyncoccia bacterium]|jgi:hypothetical protein